MNSRLQRLFKLLLETLKFFLAFQPGAFKIRQLQLQAPALLQQVGQFSFSGNLIERAVGEARFESGQFTLGLFHRRFKFLDSTARRCRPLAQSPCPMCR